MRPQRCLLAGGLLLALLASRAFGQTTFATLTGIVTDGAGGVIPGATVEARHVLSNYTYTTATNEVGHYTLGQLREGEYVLRVQIPGFREFVAQNIQLAAQDLRRIDVRLEIGPLETAIEVSAGATLIETETARISDSKDARALKVLPLNTRQLWNYLSLTPGVVQAGGGSSTRRFAGSRANQSDASIDGITVSNGTDGTQISPLVSYVESFQEFRVDMANNTAEYGAIGQVTVVSKSGTNQFHGNIFDYYSTPMFRARNPFSPTRSSGVRHTPGGSIGGPVRLPGLYNGGDRTFFFHSFETSRGSPSQQLLNPTVAPASWRAGDFSDLLPGIVIRDPLNNNTPFPGNRIPDSRLNPVSRKIQERFFPLPNFGDTSRLVSQNYRENKARPFDPNTYYTIRIDHRFSPESFVFARWTWNRSHSRAYEGNLPTIGQRWQTRETRAFNVSFTRSLRANMMNEFRFGMAYNDNPRNGPLMGRQIAQELGIEGLVDDLPDINGVLNVGFTGIGLTGITQTQWRHPGFLNFVQQYQEHLSWTHGRHSLKMGALLSRVRFSDHQASNNLFGNVTFSNRFTGHPYADFLLGIPTTAARAFPPIRIDRIRWAYDLFVTDDFKLRPNLTVNLGLRYELHPGWAEETGRQALFDVETGKIIVPDGTLSKISPLQPRGYVDVVEAGRAGFHSSRLLKTDVNNLAPRIGIAYRPWGNSTVFRAGYGIFFDIIPRTVSTGGAPFVINEPSFTNPAAAPAVIFPRVFPATVGGPTQVSLPTATRPDLRTPYSMQYNFTVERQQWNSGFRVSYIGTNTRQGEWGSNINQPVADTRRYIDKPRRFPNYPAITYIDNGAGHQYHSLTLETERRYSRGLAYQFSYVLASDIGDLERGEVAENAYDRGRERGRWLDIPTHRIAGFVLYELPVGRGKRFLTGAHPLVQTVTGGWELTVIYQRHSGQFLTPLWTGPDPTGTAFTTSGTAPQVTIRPDLLRDPNLPPAERTTTRWFDPTAFAPPTPGSFGTAAKGVIHGPGSTVWDVGLAKHFDLGERLRLRWELTATNLFNHPNYSNPGTNISSLAQAGVISGVGDVSDLDPSGPRSFRMGLRLEW
ncbi:MAG: TonB-dependent receptor [Acidobacteria bacterium]|nr:TonB-dependent receptor [Acidobacteriota bacterium]